MKMRGRKKRLLVLCSVPLLSACGHDYKYYLNEGDQLKEKAKFNEASASYEAALKESKKEKTKQPMLLVLLRQAEVKRAQNKSDEALGLFEKAAELTDKIPAEGAARKANIYNQEAAIYLGNHNAADAASKLKESLQLLQDAGKESTADGAEANSLMGNIYSEAKQYSVADKFFRKGAVAYADLENSDGLSRTLYAMANNCRLMGLDDRAASIEEQARSIAASGIHEATAKHYVRLYQ